MRSNLNRVFFIFVISSTIGTLVLFLLDIFSIGDIVFLFLLSIGIHLILLTEFILVIPLLDVLLVFLLLN